MAAIRARRRAEPSAVVKRRSSRGQAQMIGPAILSLGPPARSPSCNEPDEGYRPCVWTNRVIRPENSRAPDRDRRRSRRGTTPPRLEGGRSWQVVARIGTSGHDGALIAALLGGASVEDAARLAGLSLRTAYRRLADPTFRDTLAEAKQARLARVVEVMVRSGGGTTMTQEARLSRDRAPG